MGPLPEVNALLTPANGCDSPSTPYRRVTATSAHNDR